MKPETAEEKKIRVLQTEIKTLLRASAEYKRQAIEYSNKLDEAERTMKLLDDLSDFINSDPGTTFLSFEGVWPGSADAPYYTCQINGVGGSSGSIEKAVRKALEKATEQNRKEQH